MTHLGLRSRSMAPSASRRHFLQLLTSFVLLSGLTNWAIAEETPAAPPASAPAAIPGLAEALKKKHPTTVADLKAIEQQVRRVVDKVTPCTVGIRIGSSSGSG